MTAASETNRWNEGQFIPETLILAMAQLVKAKTKVRVASWLMWDQEHQAHVGNSRLSLWEIHPIHMIRVFKGRHWADI